MLAESYYQRIAIDFTSATKVEKQLRSANKVQRAGALGELKPLEGELEIDVASMWTEVLGVEPIGASDSFFALGGTSLQAAQVASRLMRAYDIAMSLIEFFDNPTVEQQAYWIEATILKEIESAGE